MSSEIRLVFLVEWFDIGASMIRKYQLMYYLKDKTFEMYDLINMKLFMKRLQQPHISEDQLYIGSIFTINSRQLKIFEYGDVFTKKSLENVRTKTFCMIKPDGLKHIGKIIQTIEENGLIISNLKMAKLSLNDAQTLLQSTYDSNKLQEAVQFTCSDAIVGMELFGQDALTKWNFIIGALDPTIAKRENPKSLRGYLGQDIIRNIIHGSVSIGDAEREINYFFSESSSMMTSAVFKNSTCCLLKPHILLSHSCGKIINQIQANNFEVTAMQMIQLDRSTSEEFFSVYKGVLPEYKAISEHFLTGAALVMELTFYQIVQKKDNCVNEFRALCGPHDPVLAKSLYPNSLRAQFGIDRVKNVVHCTDLPEDGVLEYLLQV